MRKTIKHAFPMFYTLIKHGSERTQGPLYILKGFMGYKQSAVAPR